MNLKERSLGGVTVIDVCKIDARCRAGVNLDGGWYGQHQWQPLKTPFLSMVSARKQKYGEHLLVHSTSDYYEVLLEGAGHGDSRRPRRPRDSVPELPLTSDAGLGIRGQIGNLRGRQ